jgi:hypothetical protein
VRTETLAACGNARSRRWVLAFALCVAPSCTSDHGKLELRPHAAGMGGLGGVSAAGQGGSGGALTRPPAAGSGGVEPTMHIDTPGRSVFTVVHGIVDADLTAWCFARVRDGATTLVGDPVPAGGLGYGQSLSFETLSGVTAASDGVVPYVITGDLSQIDGLDCEAAVARAQAVMAADNGASGASGQGGALGEGGAGGGDAGASSGGASHEAEGGAAGDSGAGGQSVQLDVTTPAAPALRVGALPGLPAGSLAAGYSMIEVAAGCFGAKAYTARLERIACGVDYTPDHGSLTAEIAILARDTEDNALALQALHASHASGDLGVSSAPGPLDSGTGTTLVDNFAEGALRPRDPSVAYPVQSWGANTSTWTVNATMGGVDYATELWADIRERAGMDQLENGRGYTLIAIGPSLGITDTGFWHDFAFALVDNDPSVP